MIDTPQILVNTPQITAVIRLTITREEIRNVMGPGLTELFTTIAAQGIAPAGAWFTHHLRMDPEVFDFEIGIPVTSPVVAMGRVTPGELPGTKLARTIYRGPYEGLSDAWGEFDEWIRANGYGPASWLWESYIAGPESSSDPSQWQTQLNRPLV